METRSWRAGSGMLGAAGRNSCVKTKGWLPNGTYRMRQYNDYDGNLIKGRAFRLDDKRCPNGKVRVRPLHPHRAGRAEPAVRQPAAVTRSVAGSTRATTTTSP